MDTLTNNPNATLLLGKLSPDELAALASISDETAVLTAYVDFTEGGQHRAEASARKSLRALRDHEPDGEAPRNWEDTLAPVEERLLAAMGAERHAGERARAVFVSFGGTGAVIVHAPEPIANLTVVARQAYLRPLMAADATSSVTGMISITHQGMTISEFWGSHQRAEWSVPVPETAEGRRLVGPSRSRLTAGRRASVQGDLAARRQDVHFGSFIDDAVGELVNQARRRGWRSVIVGGDVRDSGRAAAALREAGIDALIHPRHIESASERQAALAVVRQERVEREIAWVGELADAAGANNVPGGTAAAVEAIEAGRAGQVLIGAPAPQSVTASPKSPLLNLDDIGEDDPLERVVRAALLNMTPLHTVSGKAAKALPASGVATQLRAPAARDNRGTPANLLRPAP